MTVWILFHETNTGSSDCSDGYVEAVYATKEAAEAARLSTLRELRDNGERIWIDPDDPEDEGRDDWWDHDLVVEEHQVL